MDLKGVFGFDAVAGCAQNYSLHVSKQIIFLVLIV
jgi:hypothetical protein